MDTRLISRKEDFVLYFLTFNCLVPLVFNALFIPFSDNVNSEILRHIFEQTQMLLGVSYSESTQNLPSPVTIRHQRTLSE